MTQDFGIKIMEKGYSALTDNDIRHMILSSKFPFLNYYGQATGSITWNTGDAEIKYLDITHGLGYIPAYIAYRGNVDDLGGSGQTILPNVQVGSGGFVTFYSYIDATKIRLKLNMGDMNLGDGYDDYNYSMFNSESWTSEYMIMGKKDGTTYWSEMYFLPTIEQGDTIKSAMLEIQVDSKGAGSGDLKLHTYGYDENWSDTTAYTNNNNSLPPPGEWIGINVKDIVQELINRGDWYSGAIMGFDVSDNGSNDNVWMKSYVARLVITLERSVTINYRVIVFRNKIA
ncbi:MAG: hypothetical protein PHO75_02200 [Candidatus Shapirobacteria bacterium]|nr:hypothetical protein [Candidatus Shapirobacteria bacterium]